MKCGFLDRHGEFLHLAEVADAREDEVHRIMAALGGVEDRPVDVVRKAADGADYFATREVAARRQ